jgi:GxxExxY protein
MNNNEERKDYPEIDITREIIGAAMEVHRRLGPGFLESVYEEALAVEFKLEQIQFERQKELPVIYRGEMIKMFVCDFLVSDKVIVELKAIKETGEIEKIQVISYLKASGLKIGLLLNFGCKSLEFKRLINSNSRKDN